MSDFVVETRNLTKRYRRGARPALDQLNLQVPRGALFGFIGPNGAGKTTTLRLLAGLLEPTRGEIWVAGHSMLKEPQTSHRCLGYMPDFFGIYPEMTAWEYLDFFARCYDLPGPRRSAVVAELLDLVGLADKRNEDIRHLSRGMQQRLCLAHTLVHDPQVLLLDEPASGLDPRARVEMRELLRELSTMGKTIILSSHILSELAEMCTEVGIIERGRLVASGPLAQLRQRARPGRVLRLRTLSDAETAVARLNSFPGAADAVPLAGNGESAAEGVWIECYLTGDAQAAADLLAFLVSGGIRVIEFREMGNELEELFLQLTVGETA